MAVDTEGLVETSKRTFARNNVNESKGNDPDIKRNNTEVENKSYQRKNFSSYRKDESYRGQELSRSYSESPLCRSWPSMSTPLSLILASRPKPNSGFYSRLPSSVFLFICTRRQLIGLQYIRLSSWVTRFDKQSSKSLPPV